MCRLPSTPSIECHCWLARMASRLPALVSAVRWLAQSEKIFFFPGKRAKSWRPHFRGERHPIPFDGGNTSRWPRGASSGPVAWRDCKGLTDGQRGPANDGRLRSRGSRKSGDGTHGFCWGERSRGSEGRCQSLAGDHGVQQIRGAAPVQLGASVRD